MKQQDFKINIEVDYKDFNEKWYHLASEAASASSTEGINSPWLYTTNSNYSLGVASFSSAVYGKEAYSPVALDLALESKRVVVLAPSDACEDNNFYLDRESFLDVKRYSHYYSGERSPMTFVEQRSKDLYHSLPFMPEASKKMLLGLIDIYNSARAGEKQGLALQILVARTIKATKMYTPVASGGAIYMFV